MTTPTVLSATYRHHLLRARNGGNYFNFHRDYLLILPRVEALFIQDLLNHAATREERWLAGHGGDSRDPPLILPLERGNYFWCSVGYLSGPNSLKWSGDEQTRHLASLARKGYVHSVKKGLPPRRYVFVDLLALETAIDAAVLSQWPQNCGQRTPQKSVSNKEERKQKKENCRQSADADVPTDTPEGTSGMPFIPIPTDPKVSPLDLEQAHVLHRSVISAGKRVAKVWKPSAWAKQIAKLRRDLGACPEGDARIASALAWYAPRVGKEFVPQAWSGESFREKFTQIEQAIARDAKRNPTVEVSPEAKKLAARLGEWKWPGDSAKHLPAVVELSLRNYRKLYEGVRRVEADGPSHCRRFATNMLHCMSTADKFLTDWFRGLIDTIRYAEKKHRKTGGWKGKLTDHVFSADSIRFENVAQEWARKYAGPGSKLWEQLRGAL